VAPPSFIALPREMAPLSKPVVSSSRVWSVSHEGRAILPSSVFIDNAIPPLL
jgi:hypothetical protein